MALGVCVLVIWLTFSILKKVKYRKLETEVFNELGISSWEIVPYFDANVRVKSRQALDKYDDVKFFKENKEKLYMNPKRCKGCGYCINACPQDALSVSDFVNEKGYNTVQVDETKCVACGMCYRVCPDYVFEIR